MVPRCNGTKLCGHRPFYNVGAEINAIMWIMQGETSVEEARKAISLVDSKVLRDFI